MRFKPRSPADRRLPHLVRSSYRPTVTLTSGTSIRTLAPAFRSPSYIQERCDHEDVVDSAATRGIRRHRRRNRGFRHVGAGCDHLGPARRHCIDCLSLVAGTQHRGRLGLDHPGARDRKHDLADCDHDSNEDGGSQPTEEQMETILNAVLFGLFTSVFWITFAFGLFKRIREQNAPPAPPPGNGPVPARSKKKRARR